MSSAQIESGPVPSKAWGFLALATVASIPFACAIEFPLTAKRSLNLTAFDPLSWLASTWLLVAWWRRGMLLKQVGCFLSRAWPAVLLMIAAMASAAAADFSLPQSKTLFLKSLIQWKEYLIVAPLVFWALLSDETWRRRALYVAAAAICIAVLAAGVQLFGSVASVRDNPHALGGLLGNRNTYGMFLVLMLPFLFVAAKEVNRSTNNKALYFFAIPIMVVFLLAFLSCRQGACFLGVVIGLILLSGLLSPAKNWHVITLLAILYFGLGLFHIPPKEQTLSPGSNLDGLLDSIQIYKRYTDPETGSASYRHTARYYRWAANLEMVRDNPRLGVGLGQYEKRNSEYYGPIPKPSGRTDDVAGYDVTTDEPLSFGWFFLVASELGLIGAAALLFLLADAARQALLNWKAGAQIALAVPAAFAGLIIAGWFTNPMVRGCGGALAFLLALAWMKWNAESETTEAADTDAD